MRQRDNSGNAKKGEAAFEELIAYCSAEEKTALLEQLQTLPQDPDADRAFAGDIIAGRWTKLFNDENRTSFPLRSLHCLRSGLISSMTYVTSQKFYNVYTHPYHRNHTVRIEQVFNPENGKRNVNSCNMIRATMKLASASFKAYLIKAKEKAIEDQKKGPEHNSDKSAVQKKIEELLVSTDFKIWDELEKANHLEWTPEQETKFYQYLKQYPRAEHCFILLPDPHFDGRQIKQTESLIQHISYRLGFNPFTSVMVGGIPMRMIPSEGMIEAFLKATRLYTIHSVYRFGLSPILSMHNTMKEGGRERVVTTALLPGKTPKIIDGQIALEEYAEAEAHEPYHLTLCGNIPPEDNDLFVLLADEMLRVSETDAECADYARHYAEAIIDMEHRAYDSNIGKSIALVMFEDVKERNQSNPKWQYWVSLEFCDIKADYNMGYRESEKNDELQEQLDREKERLINHLVRWLLDNEQHHISSYGLSLESLLNYYPDNYKSMISEVQRKLRSFLRSQVDGKELPQLFELIVPSKRSPTAKLLSHHFSVRPAGQLLRSTVLEEMEGKIKSHFFDGLVYAYSQKSPLLLEIVLKVFYKNFQRFLDEGVIENLRLNHTRAYNYLMNHFRHTEDCGQLLREAIIKREGGRKAFDLLYDPALVNKVYSDKRTLIYHALNAEDVDLMFRLTSDGADVGEVKGAEKPCALSVSILSCRAELVAILMLAYHRGKGWMAQEKDNVERIRRIAASRSLSQDDEQWYGEILRMMPPHLVHFSLEQMTVMKQEAEQDTNTVATFFQQLNKGGPIDFTDPVTSKFIELKTWNDRGGLRPIPKVPEIKGKSF